MPERIDPKVLRKVRDMIRAGFTQSEAAKACNVSLAIALRQGRMLEIFEGFCRNEAGNLVKAGNGRSANKEAKRLAARSHEYDPEALDLVDMLNTPRTIRQLRRFAGDDV
jgi:hypothetical protein